MKRFHVHVSVSDIAQSVGFYSTLFGSAPTVQKDDYAKWMLDDPRINFAISNHGHTPGLDHLGLQVDSADELHTMTDTLQQAGVAVTGMGAATCCYAQSEKGWVHDPQGIAWESFVTTGASTTYGTDHAPQGQSTNACCAPSADAGVAAVATVATAKPKMTLKDIQVTPAASCCTPVSSTVAGTAASTTSCC
jgi:catechol 2,3-dioxygenase-like lactoylglutathione lyase family enzyme